jgi:hypothetical protein
MSTSPLVSPSESRQIIGWREWVGLPELGIKRLKVKVDTGARTSALHAFSVEAYTKEDGVEWVKFGMHPKQHSNELEVFCHAPILDRRLVRDSGGNQTERIVIVTDVQLGLKRMPIELTLTSRDDMLFRMLLGRTAMRGLFFVDPGRSFLLKKQLRQAQQDSGK